jgi:N-formylglutamate amidohydrolase
MGSRAFGKVEILGIVLWQGARMPQTAFTIARPFRRETSVIFSSPHSGRDYTSDFLATSLLDARVIRSSEDAYVDQLFGAAPACGAPLISALVPRAYLDLNRACDELDPALIEGVARSPHNPRVSSGLGVIPRVVANGRTIYRGKMTMAQAEARIAQVWHPYHTALRRLIDESHAQFGEAILIDCHSMPHEAIEVHARPGNPRPDVVLGDRFGSAAGRDVMERVEAAFASAGLRVVRNSPFAGAYITQAYGRPSRRQHVVQVEVDRGLYLNEATVELKPDFAVFQQVITDVVAEIAGIGRQGIPLAAE